VIDMSTNGEGEWHMWNNASFFGASYIWTTLHDFGGTDGMKGNLAQINQIPFDATNQGSAGVVGTGFTPEGIDQNPVYYEFMLDQNYRDAPVPDIPSHAVQRAHRRYALTAYNPNVDTVWRLLVESAYAQDLSVQDSTGVPHLPGGSSQFQPDRFTPTPRLCQTYNAWKLLVTAAGDMTMSEPLRYDLVNLGRELLAQLATPASQNFSDALGAATLDARVLNETGSRYIELLDDVNSLVGTDTAFLLGPWIQWARSWGADASDCGPTLVGSMTCPDFYEWNARVQLSTWNPTVRLHPITNNSSAQ